MSNYLFGTPAEPRKPSSSTQSDWFILGAYPSALYIRWEPPGERPIAAVAVADEPEPFWAGKDQEIRIMEWADNLHWNPGWGRFTSPGKLNGSSGSWLFEKVFTPLRINRVEAWITDCLDLYHESKGAARRLNDPVLQHMIEEMKIRDRDLPAHPSESQIVSDAHYSRLRRELAVCRPRHVITLGNAALRVFANLMDDPPPIKRLAADRSYGRTFNVRIPGGNSADLLPLAHPAAPAAYQDAHKRWKRSRNSDA